MSESTIRSPLPREILQAREQINDADLHAYADGDMAMRTMHCWAGVGWHKNEIMLGILVGLQIAENRNKENRNKEK